MQLYFKPSSAMSRRSRRYARFTRVLVSLGVVLLGVDIVVGYILRRTGEQSDVSRIVDEQRRTDAMYLSLLNDNEFQYKVELVRDREPQIVALGSSRILPLREEFFDTSFANAGRAVTQINHAPAFLRAVEPDGLPAVILFGLDFWWFHAGRARVSAYEPDPAQDDDGIISLDKIRLLRTQWAEGRVPVRDLIRKVVFNEEPAWNRRFGFRSVGLSAMAGFHGFRRDGSYFYGGLLVGRTESDDTGFNKTLKRIERGTTRFAHGDAISDMAWTILIDFVKSAEAQGVHVILFMSPVAPVVADKLKGMEHSYRYVDSLRSRLAALEHYHDYHDPTVLNATDCEFIDGFHGGDVVFQRILLDMAETDPVLGRFVDTSRLSESIRLHGGRALVPRHPVETSPAFNEVDFLDLGCEKGASASHGVSR